MTNRYPLVVNANSLQIEEIQTGDTLIFSNGGIEIDVANLTVTGGSNAQVLTTDGTGNLSWTTSGGANVDFLNVSSNIIPSADNTYSLGNATNQWASAYIGANTLYINNVPVSVVGNTLTVAGESVVTEGTTSAGNITTTGNIAANYFLGNGSELTGITAGASIYIVDGVTGNDTTGDGSFTKPFATIQAAHDYGVAHPNSSQWIHIQVNPNQYSETINLTYTNVYITGSQDVRILGTINVADTCVQLKFDDIQIRATVNAENRPAASRLDIWNCTVAEGTWTVSNPTRDGFFYVFGGVFVPPSITITGFTDAYFNGAFLNSINFYGVPVAVINACNFYSEFSYPNPIINVNGDGPSNPTLLTIQATGADDTLTVNVDGVSTLTADAGFLGPITLNNNGTLVKTTKYTDITGTPTLGNIVAVNLNGNASTYLNGLGNWATVSSGNASLPLANGTSNFNIATADGYPTITANGATWSFGSDLVPEGLYWPDGSFQATAFVGIAQDLSSNTNATIISNASGNTSTWTFGDDGRLTFPGTPRIDTDANNFEVQAAEAINFEANTVVNIYTDTSNAAYQWQFGDDGNLTLPDVANVSINYANGQPYSSGGNSTPGGSDTQVQFNANGVFAGNSGFTFDSANASNGLRVTSSFTANPGAHYIQVEGLSATIGSAIDGGLTVANATTTINTPGTSITSTTINLGDNGTPGNAFLTVDANGVSLGQTAGQLISVTSANGISIGGTGGVTIQGVASATVTLGGSTGGNIDVINNINLGAVTNVHITGGSSGQVLSTDGAGSLSWVTDASTPAGSNTQVQFNNAGVFGSDANFTYNSVLDELTAPTITCESLGAIDGGFANIEIDNYANLGGVANINILGGTSGQVLATDGTGNLSFVNQTPAAVTLANEYHVSPQGSDTTGTGTQDSPYQTVQYAVNQASTGNAKVILHVGGYNEDVTIDVFNTSLIAAQSDIGGLVRIYGNLTIGTNGNSTRVVGVTANTLSINSGGTFYGDTISVLTGFEKTGTGYVEITNSDLQLSAGNITVTGNNSSAPATLALLGSKASNIVASANSVILVQGSENTTDVTVDGGLFSAVGSVLFTSNASVAAVSTTANGGIVNLYTSSVTTTAGAPAKLNIAGVYGINGVVYDVANSTVTGLSANTNTSFQTITTDNIVLSGSLVSSGASPAPTLSGFSSVSAINITATGNVSANVANVTTLMKLTAQGTPPTPVAGGIYYDGSAFRMCADGATWQTVNLT